MNIIVAMVDGFYTNHYDNAKKLEFNYSTNKYVITKANGETVEYTKGKYLITIQV